MPRKPRFLPTNPHGQLVEVSCRTVEARALLRPSRAVDELVVGVLGRALEVSPVEICAVTALSSHYHALLCVEDQNHLSRFMTHFNGNLSKEINRHHGREGPLWSRRYDAVLVSDEPEAQWARLKYVLANGTKEGLVESPLLWPGVQSARSLITGRPLEGYWFHRTKEWAARRRGEIYEHYDYATRYQVALARLPCCRDMDPEEYRERIEKLIREIEDEVAEHRQGRPVLGVEAVNRQNPHEKPSTKKPKKSPRPEFHVATTEARAALRQHALEFYLQYYTAADLLRAGHLEAIREFPEGCFPSPLPFVGNPAPPRPPSPPTRQISKDLSGTIRRGGVPSVPIGGSRSWNVGIRDP